MYHASKDYHIELLRKKAELFEAKDGSVQKRSPFLQVRHYIGRLAYRIRAYEQLVEDSAMLDYVFLQHEVKAVPLIKAAPMPPPDSHTNLEGILNRMLRKDDAQRKDIEDGLFFWDRCSGIFSRFTQQYSRCRPVVHAEVQALEYFYTNGLKYAGNDRYVACSKPSCFCCLLYFKHHPSRVVIPAESHQKVWPNWGLPKIEKFKKGDVASNRQRDLVNKIAQTCREEIIFQVLGRSSLHPWHPDSQTAISDVPLVVQNTSSQNSVERTKLDSEEDYSPKKGGVSLI